MKLPIDTRQLRYFVAVAEELHVGRAAARLHISQPPLSRQIQQLERRVGASLFHREGRRIRLTVAGASFREDAERILNSLDQAERRARLIAQGARGSLRVGFVSTALYSVLPTLVRDFHETNPDIHLELKELTVDAQLRAFAEDSIDLGFMMCPAENHDISTLTVFEESLTLCVPGHHRLARARKPVELDTLDREAFIMFPRQLSPGLYDRIIGFAEKSGFSLTIGQEAIQMQTIVGLVSAGVGLAIVPECMTALRRPGVTYRSLARSSSIIDTRLAHRRDSTNPLVEAFKSFVSVHVAS
jgi:DNA-binding transcriptional LysR family regulator